MITNEKGDLPPLLFVHIPKTAGISVRVALMQRDQDKWIRFYHFGHDPYKDLKRYNYVNNAFKFCVVRNPFTRAYSYFNLYKRIVNQKATLKDFLLSIKQRQLENTSLLLMLYDQSFFIYDNNVNEMNKVYYFENLSELENDLRICLPKTNVGKYTSQQYYEDYTTENIELVREIYSNDFRNFKYSDEFS